MNVEGDENVSALEVNASARAERLKHLRNQAGGGAKNNGSEDSDNKS